MSQTQTPLPGTTTPGFDVWWQSPMGDSGWTFRAAATADQAAAILAADFARENYPAKITDTRPTLHTADRITWLLIGYGVWGHGETLDEAKRNLKVQGWRLTDGYIQVMFPVGLSFRSVTGMGGYRYEAIGLDSNDVEPVERIVPGRKFKK